MQLPLKNPLPFEKSPFLRNFRAAFLLCLVFVFAGACRVTLDTGAVETPSGVLSAPTSEKISTTNPPEARKTTAPRRTTSTPKPAGLAACIPPKGAVSKGVVTYITDGDTIHVKIGAKEYKVRYIGINAPEDTKQVDPFGPEATAKNRELVENQTVTLIKDVSETDKYGRLLRYVFVGSTFVNYELVRQGYAHAGSYPPDVACTTYFRTAEKKARSADAGLWSLK